MQNKKVIILIILAIAAIFSLFYGITVNPKGKPSKEAVVFQGYIALTDKIIMPAKRRAKKTKFSSYKRSPFIPKSVSTSTSSLTGIIWDELAPKAIIGDTIVGVGDKIGGNTVVSIEKDKVVLSDGSRDFELKLGQ